MRRQSSFCLALLLSIVGGIFTGRADTIEMQFTIAGFGISNGNPAPTDPITGSIRWEAADVHSPIQQLDSISLTLDGHSYSVAGIGNHRFTTPTWDLIGGLANGPGTIGSQTDDFYIRWDYAQLTGFDFAYSSSRLSGIWDDGHYTSFSIVNLSIPEPSTLTLAALGLVALGGLCAARGHNPVAVPKLRPSGQVRA